MQNMQVSKICNIEQVANHLIELAFINSNEFQAKSKVSTKILQYLRIELNEPVEKSVT